MMQKYVEGTCDYCGNAGHSIGGSITYAKEYFRSMGYIITRGNKFYCDKRCQKYDKKVDFEDKELTHIFNDKNS